MWESYYKAGWKPKNWCFWIVSLEKTFVSPLDCKEIQPVNPKGNQPWIFIGRTDAEAPVTLAIWCKELSRWKRPWCWERLKAEKGMTKDEMVGGITDLMDMNLSKLKEMVKDRKALLQSMGSQRVRHIWTTEQSTENITELYKGAM